MKRNTLLLYTLLFAAACLWLASSGGAGANQDTDRTGGPLAQGFCSNCHQGGDFGANVSLTLVTAQGDTVTEYEPGAAYTLQVSIAANGAEGFGFMAVALDGANAGAGTFGAPAGGTQVTSISGIDYFEHSQRSGTSAWEIEWTAPSAGTGDVAFYAAGNAVNANGGTSGDDPDTTSLTLPEAQVSGLYDLAQFELQVAPNPAQDFLQIQWSDTDDQPEHLAITNSAGQAFYQRSIAASTRSIEVTLSQYPAGIYFVRLASSDGLETRRFVKL